MVQKTEDRVRVYTRRGADWTHRFPRVVAGVRKLRSSSILLDGEGVVCDGDGISDFNRLHSRTCDDDVFLYAFDLLELDGEDLRLRELKERKQRLGRLLPVRPMVSRSTNTSNMTAPSSSSTRVGWA